MYRMQVFDDRTTGMHWHVHKTGARHYDGYRRQGRRMPVAVALGGDPVYAYAATAPMPDNMDEYLLAGFLRRRPVELVRCLTCGIEVPADCDFVIEGCVDPAEEKTVEGPFGDHTGFYSLEDRYPPLPRDGDHPPARCRLSCDGGWGAARGGRLHRRSDRADISAPIRLAVQPEVRDLWMPTAGTAHNLAIVAIERRYEGQAHKVAQSLWGAGQMMFNKYLVVADAATEIRRVEALAALVRRLDPARDLIAAKGCFDVLDHATATSGFGGKLALNLTRAAAREEGNRCSCPNAFEPCGGVAAAATGFAERWRTLALFVDRRTGARRCGGVLRAESGAGREVRRAVRPQAEGLTGAELLWLAAADSDPRRDVTVVGGGRGGRCAQQAPRRGGASRAVPERGRRLVCDGGAGGCTLGGVRSGGETMASPSERYRRLLLSDKAAW